MAVPAGSSDLLISNNHETVERIDQIGIGKKYLIITFGCQMNEHDSEVMAALVENIGYVETFQPEEADLIIINTCAVRQKPEDKVASLLGKFIKLKDNKKNLVIAVAGCMTQQEDLAKYIKERFQHVDLIFGTHALPRLPDLLKKTLSSKSTIVDIIEDYGSREGLPINHHNFYKAWLPVIYGCNNYCSYCIVPYVRGRERSRKMKDILNEAQSLTAKGVIELTLLGQNVNSYGHDLPESIHFAELLLKLNALDGLERIRFMTSHPKDLSEQLIDAVSQGEKICEHFHLPVQSGSNRILDQMNRHYTREHYLGLIKRIRDQVPDASITSDFIVGFPGETETDFNETLSLIEEARFDNAFSFLYSPRKKTAAASLPDQLNLELKEERLQRLNELQHRISKEQNMILLNKEVEVLSEGSSKSKPELYTGRTRNNKLVHFESAGLEAGKLISVKITEARTWNLLGKLKGDC
jgi:tRNA-2-methylthio-N6-dimethylallyladenosine synthase